MNQVNIGSVRTFPDVNPDKAQALKPLEEAAEVFNEWQRSEGNFNLPIDFQRNTNTDLIMSECADVIQAVCNLAASLGVYDLEPYMQACEQRNRERGRM